jgi:hypothetical protein
MPVPELRGWARCILAISFRSVVETDPPEYYAQARRNMEAYLIRTDSGTVCRCCRIS